MLTTWWWWMAELQGLSAALVLGRARRRVALIDAGAPRNAPAAHMQGFLSRDGMPPADLLAEARAEVTGYGVELVRDQVLGIVPGFVVRLAAGRIVTARRVLIRCTRAGDPLGDEARSFGFHTFAGHYISNMISYLILAVDRRPCRSGSCRDEVHEAHIANSLVTQPTLEARRAVRRRRVHRIGRQQPHGPIRTRR